uniref:Glutamate-rich WD repeat-containing protein 1 n=1 Tax=Strigamia maritima TaxID=126957 RepID=T1J1V9_STRMM
MESRKRPRKEEKAVFSNVENDDEFDKSAYSMHHVAQTGAPCLSFDVIADKLGANRTQFPHTAYLVAGTQASLANRNKLIVTKMSNLNKIKIKTKENEDEEEDEDDDDDDDDDSSDSSDDEDDAEKPNMIFASVKQKSCINRVRARNVNETTLAATWSESGSVDIWNLTDQLNALDDPQRMVAYLRREKAPKPAFTFTGHSTEGFALDWSLIKPGYLATGDCNKCIHVWKPQEGGTWQIDERPYESHTGSVEDVQWSPNEANVFASCSVDKSIRVWDVRTPKEAMLVVADAHDSDVNVISWNRTDPFIVSGGDDGVIKVWDLKLIETKKPVAVFKHHTAPVTSVEWNPNDSTVFAASGGDDQLTQWDLSVEKDGEMETEDEDEDEDETKDLPPQLLFVHEGQREIKELHWHPQIPGVVISTANTGFNVFRTISV